MPLSDLRCYFRCLFSALDSTHSHNIIHRDIKPANFLYDPRTGEGTLCDFGLAEVSAPVYRNQAVINDGPFVPNLSPAHLQRFDPHEWRGKCHHTCPSETQPHGKATVNRSVFSVHTQAGGALHDGSKLLPVDARKKSMAPPERVGVLKEDTRYVVT